MLWGIIGCDRLSTLLHDLDFMIVEDTTELRSITFTSPGLIRASSGDVQTFRKFRTNTGWMIGRLFCFTPLFVCAKQTIKTDSLAQILASAADEIEIVLILFSTFSPRHTPKSDCLSSQLFAAVQINFLLFLKSRRIASDRRYDFVCVQLGSLCQAPRNEIELKSTSSWTHWWNGNKLFFPSSRSNSHDSLEKVFSSAVDGARSLLLPFHINRLLSFTRFLTRHAVGRRYDMRIGDKLEGLGAFKTHTVYALTFLSEFRESLTFSQKPREQHSRRFNQITQIRMSEFRLQIAISIETRHPSPGFILRSAMLRDCAFLWCHHLNLFRLSIPIFCFENSSPSSRLHFIAISALLEIFVNIWIISS